MKLAFILYNYFPYGGLQRDFLDIALAAAKHDHKVDVYTLSWQGDKPNRINIHEIDVSPKRNHNRYKRFTALLTPLLKTGNYDRVVGFNKMPGLDVYYGADPCFEHKARTLRGWYYRYTARYRHFSSYERMVFSPAASTKLLMLSEAEKKHCIHYYGTPKTRFHVLPPAVSPHCLRPVNADNIRWEFRAEFGYNDDDLLTLCIGSDFERKGVDRAIRALAALPEEQKAINHLLIVGRDDPTPMTRLAKQLDVEKHVRFFQGRDDVPRFLFSADLFVHAARSENTGTVILESVVAGLPALVTANCGYATHVTRADAGLVCESPFDQSDFNRQFAHMLTSSERERWCKNGSRYTAIDQIQNRTELIVNLIEQP